MSPVLPDKSRLHVRENSGLRSRSRDRSLRLAERVDRPTCKLYGHVARPGYLAGWSELLASRNPGDLAYDSGGFAWTCLDPFHGDGGIVFAGQSFDQAQEECEPV